MGQQSESPVLNSGSQIENISTNKVIINTIIIIFFMQGIYTYIPQTNYVPREYSVVVILLLLFLVLISLVSVLNNSEVRHPRCVLNYRKG